MAKKLTHIDWEKFLNYNLEQQNIAEFSKTLQQMTGRELYEMETYSLVNRYLIDRPVNYAFHRTVLNYPVEPIETMRSCLVDGYVFLKVGDADHIKIELYASRGEWDSFSDELVLVEIKYTYEEPGRGDWYHIEHYHKNPDGTALWIVFKPVKNDTIPQAEWKIQSEIPLPYFPYVGIRWIDSRSFLSPLKSAIVRLESAYRVIGAENIERMGLSLYIEGVRNLDDIKTAPRRMGRRVHILPKDAKFHSPGSDEPGMQLMVKEIENLHIAIEKASGVVATEKLATLSGVSRAIAEKPLIMLADELRDRFTDGMIQVADLARVVSPGAEELKITYRAMRYIENRGEYLTILDKAKEVGAITDAEYAIELRLLLDLAPEVE